MFCYHPTFFFWIYFIAATSFAIYLRFMAFSNYILCFGCQEMDSPNKSYDYIVVGSGSAGSIVARRLAEDKNVEVLLLEAGAYGGGLFDVPALGIMLQKTVYDWQYQTVPQRQACRGLKDNASLWPRGKIVGGTSMLNNMVYVRGHPKDFYHWFGDNTSYESDILPYFKKLENFGATKGSTKGSAIISDLTFLTQLSSHVLSAANSLGFQITDGLNGDQGFAIPKATMSKGRRNTPLHQLQKLPRDNVVLRTQTLVEKVLLKDNYEAYGVKYSYLDKSYQATASRGVILAGGVIGSPQILMLSGIGHKEHLKSHKVVPRLDLPVGDNLQDHVATGLDIVTLDADLEMGLTRMLSSFSAYDYFIGSGGPWTTIGCENVGFITTAGAGTPDLQLMVLPVGVATDGGAFLRTLAGIKDVVWEKYFADINGTSVTFLTSVLHPQSRGTVRLRNKNPTIPPLIDPNYLSDQYDVDVLVEGIELVKRLIETDAMRNLGAKLNVNVMPGCEIFKFDTKPYWECYVRHLTITSYHPVGTCKMGEVVDYEFRVKGTNNLYVVDGSVLPSLPSGNPNAAIMMMAEKAADLIKYHNYLTNGTCNALEVFIPKFYC